MCNVLHNVKIGKNTRKLSQMKVHKCIFIISLKRLRQRHALKMISSTDTLVICSLQKAITISSILLRLLHCIHPSNIGTQPFIVRRESLAFLHCVYLFLSFIKNNFRPWTCCNTLSLTNTARLNYCFFGSLNKFSIAIGVSKKATELKRKKRSYLFSCHEYIWYISTCLL